MPLGGVQVGSYDSYEQAQAAVDHLSDQKFAVENVTIIGSDLRQVEKVTGRLTTGPRDRGRRGRRRLVGPVRRPAARHLLRPTAAGGSARCSSGLLIGLVFGALFGGDGLRRHPGRRDFTSTSTIVAGRYDVMCQPAHAEEARAILARFSLRG